MTTSIVQTERKVRPMRWLALILSLTQLAASPVIRTFFGDFLAKGVTNQALITPSGYAFSIWGLITLLSVATCAAVVAKGLNAPWERRALVDMSVAFLGFSVWLVVAAQNWLWLTVVVFLVMVLALLDLMTRLVRRAADLECPSWLRWLTTVTFGFYLGWSSVAIFANVAAALINSGWSAQQPGWQAVELVLAVVAALTLVVALRGTPGYVGAVLWALVAIVLGAAHRGSTALAGIAAAGSVAVVVAAAVAWRRGSAHSV